MNAGPAPTKLPTLTGVNIAMSGVILFIFLAFAYPITRPYPFTDDWTYVAIQGTGLENLLSWLIAPHNDHRIPVMKAAQFLLLKLACFDFRPLLLLNAVVALSGVMAAFEAARLARGRSHFGDLFIPLILLNLSFGLFGWGFSGQFAFTVAFGLVFLALFGHAERRCSWVMLICAYGALAACALTGMNGLVVATAVAVAIAVVGFRAPRSSFGRASAILAVSVLVISAVLWAGWNPSSASASPFSVPFTQVLDWAYNLSKATFVVSAFNTGWWLATLNVLLCIGAFVAVGRRRFARAPCSEGRLFEAALVGIFGASCLLAVTLVLGRVGHSPWSAGLEMHYGYLVTPVPVLAWILLSRDLNSAAAAGLALLLLGAYGESFVTGAKWRFDYVRGESVRVSDTVQLLRSDMPEKDLADQRISEFFYVDLPPWRERIAGYIKKLRQIGGPVYGRAPSTP